LCFLRKNRKSVSTAQGGFLFQSAKKNEKPIGGGVFNYEQNTNRNRSDERKFDSGPTDPRDPRETQKETVLIRESSK
jgi:hypothetical protein